mmetsp:Transcript_29168/g.35548  ORF Transcript_29168/g.35548 Transcript_29168/m.35548 type:complete len:289 (+) Transcript_29168:778-1644(+)
MLNMGNIRLALDKAASALACFRIALQLASDVKDQLQKTVVGTLNNVENLSMKLDHNKEIHNLIKLTGPCDLVDSNDIDVDIGIITHNIGVMHLQQENYQDAQASFGIPLQLKQSVLGSDISAILVTLTNLGTTHFMLGEYDAATKCFQRALNIIKRTSNNQEYLGALTAQLGNIWAKQENYKKALQHYQTTLTIKRDLYENTHGNTHHKIVTTQRIITILLDKDHKYEKAIYRSYQFHCQIRNSRRLTVVVVVILEVRWLVAIPILKLRKSIWICAASHSDGASIHSQ